MKKQYRSIGILCICLAIIGGTALFLTRTEEKKSDTGRVDEEIVLSELDMDSLEGVTVENQEGGYHIRWANGNLVVEGLEGLPLDSAEMDGVQSRIIRLTGKKEIENGKKRLEEFGLKEPAAKVNIKQKTGEEMKLCIGNSVPDTSVECRYAEWNGEVYVMEEESVGVFLNKKETFLSKKVTPSYDGAEDGFLITCMEIVRNGESAPLRVEYTESQKLAGYTVNSYQMTSPMVYPATAEVAESVLPAFFNLTAQTIEAVHPSDKQKEECGLIQPYRKAKVEYKDNQSGERQFEIVVSEPNDQGMVNVMADNVDIIYECATEDMPWLNVEEQQIVSKEIMAPDMRALSKVKIREGEKEEYEFILQNPGEKDGKVLYKDQELKMDNFKNFYYSLISMSADEVLFSGFADTEKMTGVTEISFEYIDSSKETDTVMYYQEAPRQLYATLNGSERAYRLTASQLETVLANVHKLADGQDVEARY